MQDTGPRCFCVEVNQSDKIAIVIPKTVREWHAVKNKHYEIVHGISRRAGRISNVTGNIDFFASSGSKIFNFYFIEFTIVVAISIDAIDIDNTSESFRAIVGNDHGLIISVAAGICFIDHNIQLSWRGELDALSIL